MTGFFAPDDSPEYEQRPRIVMKLDKHGEVESLTVDDIVIPWVKTAVYNISRTTTDHVLTIKLHVPECDKGMVIVDQPSTQYKDDWCACTHHASAHSDRGEGRCSVCACVRFKEQSPVVPPEDKVCSVCTHSENLHYKEQDPYRLRCRACSNRTGVGICDVAGDVQMIPRSAQLGSTCECGHTGEYHFDSGAGSCSVNMCECTKMHVKTQTKTVAEVEWCECGHSKERHDPSDECWAPHCACGAFIPQQTNCSNCGHSRDRHGSLAPGACYAVGTASKVTCACREYKP